MVESFMLGFIAVVFVALSIYGLFPSKGPASTVDTSSNRRDDDENTRETDEEYQARMRFQDFSEGEHSPVNVFDLDNDNR